MARRCLQSGQHSRSKKSNPVTLRHSDVDNIWGGGRNLCADLKRTSSRHRVMPSMQALRVYDNTEGSHKGVNALNEKRAPDFMKFFK